ncbi:MAG: glutamate-cysteine ligase family protein [Eggerthellaceae bacterium]|nr:glutamate-cysteine ligase family protein [Eggerthellaceae bacterium]
MNKTAENAGGAAASIRQTQALTGATARRRDDQPARQRNIEELVSFIESGIKPQGAPERLGIELEHTVVREDGTPVSYGEEHGIAWLLGQLQADFPQGTHDEEGDLLGVARPGAAVTIEPAAQVELSAGPFERLADARQAFDDFEGLLESHLAPQGMKALTVGYHPTARAAELTLIPKRRYRFMNMYFNDRGPWGMRMMRGSASTQVSIDYHSTADCLRKMRLAGIAGPLFALMCDNSPMLEGEPRPHKLVRTKIWQECDPDRCGIVPGSLDEGFTLERYAEYLLDTPAILIPCKREGCCYTERTFGSIYADTPMTRAQVEHMASMFFTDVRVKTYVEIRPADALPIPHAIAYAALVKGLLTTEQGLDALDGLFEGLGEADVAVAKTDLMARGYDAQAYGRPAAQLCDELMGIAARGLPSDEQPFLQPLADLVQRRATLADIEEEQLRR